MGMLDYESLAVTNASAVGISAGLYDQHHNVAVITCETAPIRFRMDGTAPTTTEGHLLDVGDVLTLEGLGEIAAFDAIATGAASVLKVSTGIK